MLIFGVGALLLALVFFGIGIASPFDIERVIFWHFAAVILLTIGATLTITSFLVG